MTGIVEGGKLSLVQMVQYGKEGKRLFLLNLQSKETIHSQLQSQLIRFIEAGILKPGDRLPSVRSLAVDNGINPNTVAKAYAELEKNGYVYNLPKKGVYVADVMPNARREEMILKVLQPLKDSGVSKEELMQALNELYGGEDAEN